MSQENSLGKSPYKGLQPYGEKDRDFFFGRETDREVIISNLFAAPLTIFYGASGVGKSSVLLAGVVPELRETKRVAVVVFREWQDPSFENALKREVLKSIDFDGQTEPDLALELDEFLFIAAKQFRGSLFFILDQFEEYFLYHPVSPQIEKFDAAFARTINRTDINANFLLSMRDDGLGKLDRFQKRIPNLLNNMLRLEHLGRRSAEMAIRKPLQKYNEQLREKQPRASIENGLVEVLLEDLQTGKVTLDLTGQGKVGTRVREDQSRRIETPFLQVVLTRLWDEEYRVATAKDANLELRLKTYESLGRATNIVRTHLDNIMETDRLRPHRATAAALFHFLVTPTGMKIAHMVGDLASYAKLPEAEVSQTLNELSAPDVRILRPIAPPPDQPGMLRYEIFHDVLAPAILDWRLRYQKVLDQQELEQQRARAEKEARSAKLFRRVSIALGAVCLIALVAIGVAAAYYMRSKQLKADGELYKKQGEQYKQEGVRLKAEGDYAKAKAREAQDAANFNAAKAAAAQAVADKTQMRANQAKRESEIRAQQIARANFALKKSQDEVQNEQLYRDAFRLSRSNNQRAEAINKFNKVLNHYRTNNNTDSLMPALFDASRVYVEMRRFDDAQNLLDEALTRSNGSAGKAATLAQIGDLYSDYSVGFPEAVTRSAKAYQDAYDIYGTQHDTTGQTMTLLSKAQGAANRAYYIFSDQKAVAVSNAMSEFDAAANFAHQNKPDLEGLVWLKAAEAQSRLYIKYDFKVIALYEKARSAYASASDIKGEITALTQIIQIRSSLSDSTGVAKERTDLLVLCRKDKDLICEARTLEEILRDRRYAEPQADTGERIQLASQSRSAFLAALDRDNNTVDDLQTIGAGLSDLSFFYSTRGDDSVAVETATKAAAAFRLSGNHDGQLFRVLDSLVGFNLEMSKTPEAREYLKEAIEESKNLYENLGKFSALAQIGQRYADLKDDVTAASYFESALSGARAYDSSGGYGSGNAEINVVCQIGGYLIRQNQEDKARHYFDQVLTKQRPPKEQLQALKQIANTYYNSWGSQALMDTALTFYERALTIAHTVTPNDEGVVLQEMAKVYRKRGKDGDIAKADACEKRASELITPSSSPNVPQSQKP